MVVETLQAADGERTYFIKIEGRTAGTGRGVEIRTDEIEDIAAARRRRR